MNKTHPVLLGWREWIALPEFGVEAMRAKIDTGARSSSIHVERQWRFTNEGAPWVGFVIKPKRTKPDLLEVSAAITDERVVSDSGGHRAPRIFIQTPVWVGGDTRLIEINLSDRKGMLFPILLGRRALSGFAVDSDQSFLHGSRLRPKSPAGE